MGERVLVKVPERRHRHHGRLVGEHLIHDPLHRALDLPDVYGLPQTHVAECVLGNLHGLRISALRRDQLLLVVERIFNVGGRAELNVAHGSAGEALHEPIEGRLRRRLAKQHRHEWSPLAALDPGQDLDGPDVVVLERSSKGAEGREVREVQAQAGLVQEEEVPDDAHLGPTVHSHDPIEQRVQLGKGGLDGIVLDRIEPEGAERSVERSQELAALLLVVEAARLVHDANPRSRFGARG